MISPLSSSTEDFWRRRAARLSLKLNLHHWLSRAVVGLFVILVAFTIWELFRGEVGIPARWSAVFLLLGSTLALAWSWIQARSHSRSPAWQRIGPGRYHAVIDLPANHYLRGAVQVGDHVLPFGPIVASSNPEWTRDRHRVDELRSLSQASGGDTG